MTLNNNYKYASSSGKAKKNGTRDAIVKNYA